jgi:hypothetical protein
MRSFRHSKRNISAIDWIQWQNLYSPADGVSWTFIRPQSLLYIRKDMQHNHLKSPSPEQNCKFPCTTGRFYPAPTRVCSFHISHIHIVEDACCLLVSLSLGWVYVWIFIRSQPSIKRRSHNREWSSSWEQHLLRYSLIWIKKQICYFGVLLCCCIIQSFKSRCISWINSI